MLFFRRSVYIINYIYNHNQLLLKVDMEDSQEMEEKSAMQTEDSQDSQEDTQDAIVIK